MKMNQFQVGILSLIALFSGALFGAKQIDVDCQDKGQSESYNVVRIEKSEIKELKVGGYTVIKAGKRIEDDKIGHSVFGVSVGKLSTDRAGLTSLSVSLQDYSDVMSWKIFLTAESKEAVAIQTFQSSDGDGMLHVSSTELTCKQ